VISNENYPLILGKLLVYWAGCFTLGGWFVSDKDCGSLIQWYLPWVFSQTWDCGSFEV